MGEGQGSAGEKVDVVTQGDRTPERVQEEIEHTRAELGETVAQLAAKTDVKAQAHRAVDNAKATVAEKAREVKGKADAKKDEITSTARDATPPSADAARRQVVSQAHEHRVALALLAAFSAGMLIGRRRT